MSQVTPQGFVRTRLDERVAELTDGFKQIFGEDLNLDPDTIDGQLLGIFAESLNNLDQLAEAVYNSLSPQSATSNQLSRLVQFNGIRRIDGARSLVPLRAVGIVGTIIQSGSLVKSTTTADVFMTLQTVTIGEAGQIDIPAASVNVGNIPAVAGTLTKIETPTYGWQSVTNIVDAVPGRGEEQDGPLRIRRRASTSTSGQSILDSIYGAIANLPSVRLVKVYENDTDAPDANGQPEHSIYAIVEGGEAQEIGEVIRVKKTAGTTSVGDVAVTVQDIQGNDHIVYFDRPEYSDVYIEVTVTKFPGYPSDGAQRIKNALVEWALTGETGDNVIGLNIGEDVIQSRLYNPVNTVPFLAINSIKIGLTPSPTAEDDIIVPFNGLARIDASRITVVEL